MVFIGLEEILLIHKRIFENSGGSIGIRDKNGLESAVNQPFVTFAGTDLYPTLVEKACALGFFLIANHPFVDGNKRIGQAAMETVFILNGFEIIADIDEQERIILDVAAGKVNREDF